MRKPPMPQLRDLSLSLLTPEMSGIRKTGECSFYVSRELIAAMISTCERAPAARGHAH